MPVSRSLEEAVRLAVEGGATMVQVRDKTADGGAFVEAVRCVLEVARKHGVAVVVNDRVDVALAAGARRRAA